MAKNGELWDDSALVKALDDAISKYKIMHGKGGVDSSPDEEKITICTEESEAIVINKSNEDNTTDLQNDDQVQETTDCTYVDAQSTEHYNDLLNQYNAVEEQRQKLLGQLYQYGNWDYQNYGYDSQYQPPQSSNPPVCSCQPHVCPCLNSVSCSEDNGVIKAAMEAIDRVVHSFNTENKDGNEGEQVVKDKKSETDLSVVTNAWFTAGFYTGKYISEQASMKK